MQTVKNRNFFLFFCEIKKKEKHDFVAPQKFTHNNLIIKKYNVNLGIPEINKIYIFFKKENAGFPVLKTGWVYGHYNEIFSNILILIKLNIKNIKFLLKKQ